MNMSHRIRVSIGTSGKAPTQVPGKVPGKISGKVSGLEIILADSLRNGTYIASAVIGLGFVLHAIHWDYPMLTSTTVVKIGIALFILLPVLRVGLMLVAFIRERDRHFITIAATVLLIIFTSFALGIVLPKALPG